MRRKRRASFHSSDGQLEQWAAKLDELRATNPAAADLLNLYTSFGFAAVYENWLEQGASAVPEPLRSALARDESRTEVLDLLVDHELDGIMPFWGDEELRDFVRSRMPPEERQAWAVAAVRLMLAVVPRPGQDWPEGEEGEMLRWHAGCVAWDTEAVLAAPDVVIELLLRLVEVSPHLSRERAEALEKAREVSAGAGPRMRARVLDYLSDGRGLETAERRELREQAIRLGETAPEGEDLAQAMRLLWLGNLEYWSNDLGGACNYWARALELARALAGPGHPVAVSATRSLGAGLETLGDLEGARNHLEQGLSWPDPRPDLHGCLFTRAAVAGLLGHVCRDLGDAPSALIYFEDAVRFEELDPVPSSSILIRLLRYQAHPLASMDRWEDAVRCLERALGMLEEEATLDTAEALRVHEDLASALTHLPDRQESALDHMREALRLARERTEQSPEALDRVREKFGRFLDEDSDEAMP